MNKIGRDFVGAKKKIKVECKEISYNWLLSSKETAWTRKRNRTPMSSSFIIPCAISNRVRLSNRLWLSLKARHLSYHMALNSQKEVRNKRVHERLMSYAMKHGRCSFSWLSFTKEKKSLTLDTSSPKHTQRGPRASVWWEISAVFWLCLINF